MDATTITHTITVQIQNIEPRRSRVASLDVQFLYRSDRPYSVTMTFPGSERVTWEFGRELLLRGAFSIEQIGAGWVRVRRGRFSSSPVELRFVGNGALTIATIPRAKLLSFLRDTTRAVGHGSESDHFVWDESAVPRPTN